MNRQIIICGGPRCGSTALFRYMAEHPEIQPAVRKELNYFTSGSYVEEFSSTNAMSFNDYLQCFPDICSGQWSLESSPIYMHPWAANMVAERVARLLPDARLIFLLRNPLSRLFSQYGTDITRTNAFSSEFSFEKYVRMCLEQDASALPASITGGMRKNYLEGLAVGAYSQTLSAYLSRIPAENILVIFTETLAHDTPAVLELIADFLAIDSSGFTRTTLRKDNSSLQPQNKSFYRFALQVNRIFEPFFNKNPRVKVLLKRLHDVINPGVVLNNQATLAPKTLAEVNAYYASRNMQLRLLLKERWDLGKFPDWLASGSAID